MFRVSELYKYTLQRGFFEYYIIIFKKNPKTYAYMRIIYYNLVIKRRVVNKATNFGKIYFENTYIITNNIMKTKVTWLMK